MMTAISDYWAELTESFGRGWNRFWFTPADPLPLAVMRVLTGLVALYWYLTLAPDFERWFGPQGWLPTDVVRQVEGSAAVYEWSYFDYFHSLPELWTVYILGALALAAYIVGWQTRVASVLALATVLSAAHRAPMIGTPAEPVLAMVLLYLALGPAGARLSLDARRRHRLSESAGALSGEFHTQASTSLAAAVVTRLLQVHLALLYGCMALSKLFAESWWSGSAVWSLIARSESRLVDLTALHNHPFLVNFWTHAIVLFEFAFAILIWNRLARPLLLALAVPMWCSLTLLTGQTTLLAMMLIANLAFVPAAVFRALRAPQRAPEIAP